jgi:CHASE3 domain sensor protein
MVSLEMQLNEERETVKCFERINSELKTEIHRLRLLIAQTELEERIQKLPQAAQERLRTAFPGTNIGGLKQAVNIEKRKAGVL